MQRTYEMPRPLRWLLPVSALAWSATIAVLSWLAFQAQGLARTLFLALAIGNAWIVVVTLARYIRQVTISSKGLELRPLVGRPIRADWPQLAYIRQYWDYGGLAKRLDLVLKDGRRFVLSNQHLRDFEDMLHLVLSLVPDEKVKRQQLTWRERLTRGAYAPSREEETTILSPSRRRGLIIAAVLAVVISFLLFYGLAGRNG